jgi:hypothetical protein
MAEEAVTTIHAWGIIVLATITASLGWKVVVGTSCLEQRVSRLTGYSMIDSPLSLSVNSLHLAQSYTDAESW